MAFVPRIKDVENVPTKNNEKNELPEFDTYKDQAIYAINYLKSEYGIDIYDETRKPAQHINLPNNPNYIGGIGVEKLQETNKITTNNNLLNFINNKNK